MKVKHIKEINEDNFSWFFLILFSGFGIILSYSAFLILIKFESSQVFSYVCSSTILIYTMLLFNDVKHNFNFKSENIKHLEVKPNGKKL